MSEQVEDRKCGQAGQHLTGPKTGSVVVASGNANRVCEQVATITTKLLGVADQDEHLWLVESTTDGHQGQHQPWLAQHLKPNKMNCRHDTGELLAQGYVKAFIEFYTPTCNHTGRNLISSRHFFPTCSNVLSPVFLPF